MDYKIRSLTQEEIDEERHLVMKNRPRGTHGTEHLKGAIIEDFEVLPGTGLQSYSPAFFESITIKRTDGSRIKITGSGPDGFLSLTTHGLK